VGHAPSSRSTEANGRSGIRLEASDRGALDDRFLSPFGRFRAFPFPSGRLEPVNRNSADPLQIDILTNVVLPIEVDEVTTWDAIRPGLAEIMRARRAVPISYPDMAMAYPNLFSSAEAARKVLMRENRGQMPIEEYLIGVCPGFLSISYRRPGSRGPAGRLLYAAGINPLAWLTDRIGDVVVV
jgi:hypothetical protein